MATSTDVDDRFASSSLSVYRIIHLDAICSGHFVRPSVGRPGCQLSGIHLLDKLMMGRHVLAQHGKTTRMEVAGVGAYQQAGVAQAAVPWDIPLGVSPLRV